MPGRHSRSQRPRELRRKVMLPARLRTDSGWSDACVLNVSSRGLLVHARAAVSTGSMVELRHRDQAIVAEVMWREGTRAGLRTHDAVPVEDLLLLGQSQALQVTVGPVAAERRKRPRSYEDSRLRGRAFEFAATAVIAVTVAAMAAAMVEEALARPLAYVRGALGG